MHELAPRHPVRAALDGRCGLAMKSIGSGVEIGARLEKKCRTPGAYILQLATPPFACARFQPALVTLTQDKAVRYSSYGDGQLDERSSARVLRFCAFFAHPNADIRLGCDAVLWRLRYPKAVQGGRSRGNTLIHSLVSIKISLSKPSPLFDSYSCSCVLDVLDVSKNT